MPIGVNGVHSSYVIQEFMVERE